MKILMLILVLIVVILTVTVQGEVDWSKVTQPEIRPKVLPKGRNVNPRITGGEEAEPHSLPYQVALLISMDAGTAFCGGSLISPSTVLTAAHCVDANIHNIEVVLGAHNVKEAEDSQVKINTKKFKIHPGWSKLTLRNDLALIYLEVDLDLNDNIQLVKLPSKSQEHESFVGEVALASGWGLDHDGATSISQVLNEASLEVIPNLLCNIYYLGSIGEGHICTSGKDGKSTCSGDSGGPLVLNGEQIGIVSFGLALGCEIGWPSAFTRVTHYLDWIAANSDVQIS